MKPAVFLDRDGVINEVIFNDNIDQMDSPFSRRDFVLIEGVREAIREFHDAGYYVFVVTNQPAAAKGKTDVETLVDINRYMLELVGEEYIDNIYVCYHYPRSVHFSTRQDLILDCDCRKPKPGLLLRAKREYMIDWERSYMVGDTYTDIAAGYAADLKTVFVGNYKCEVCKRMNGHPPDIIVESLWEFCRKLLNF